METVFEGSGKSFEEALDAACKAAGVSLAEVDDKDIQILEHGSKGFFGFGSKNAKIQIIVHSACQEKTIIPQKETVKKVIKETAQEDIKKNIKEAMGEEKTSNCLDNQEIVDEKIKQAVQTALNFLSFIFEKLQIKPEHTVQYKDEVLILSFSGQNLGSLIGRRGETLNALQYLCNLAVNKGGGQHIRLVLDVEGYRKGREETLISLANKMADKAVRTGRRVELEPMNPHERRIVHLALQEDSRVDTLSRGDEPYRRIIITCKKSYRNKKKEQEIKEESK